MKIFANKHIVQKVIIAIVIVLLFNFIVPNYSHAGIGGVLMGPIIDFISAVGDAVLSALQFFFYDGGIDLGGTMDITKGFNQFTLAGSLVKDAIKSKNQDYINIIKQLGLELTSEEPDIQIDSDKFDKGWRNFFTFGLLEKDYGVPIIKYSPEAIFSNEVPSLDVNFINPKQWNNEAMDNRSVTKALHSTIANWYIALRNLSIVALLSILLYVGIRMVISSTASDKSKYKQMLIDWIVALCIVFFIHYLMSFILTVTDMITQGLAASSEITVQIKDGDQPITFNTDLIGVCRIQVQYADLGARLTYLILYIALVIYTVMFTWIYVKRAILMAFLTLIAPLVAITYPIDKISDGKAQAYGMWLKEFIFNALLQPFHLIIYTVFLGSSIEIAVENPIYAILFLAFIIPAEKILRKMFGFEKSTTAGSMSTAAGLLGGAAVMRSASNLIGKIGGKNKGNAGKAGVRTKNNAITDSNSPSKVKDMADTLSGNEGKGTIGDGYEQTKSGLWVPPGTTSQQQLSQQTQSINKGIKSNFAWKKDENGKLNEDRGIGQWLGQGIGKTVGNAKNWAGQKLDNKLGNTKFGRFVKGTNKGIRYVAKGSKNLYNSRNPISNTIRGAVGTAKKAAIGTAKFAGKATVGATFGLAAGIAGDDLEDVLKFGAAGTALGVTGLPVLGRGISNVASDMRSTYETEAFGAEEAALKEQAREKMKDDEYRDGMNELYQDMYGKEPTISESRQIARKGIEYYNAGITDTKEIRKSVKFEKELRDRMVADGTNEDDARERAKKQAMVISNMASKIDEKDLINESKRNDRRNQIFKQLKDTGMGEKEAASGADYTIQLLMKRKGLSPE